MDKGAFRSPHQKSVFITLLADRPKFRFVFGVFYEAAQKLTRIVVEQCWKNLFSSRIITTPKTGQNDQEKKFFIDAIYV